MAFALVSRAEASARKLKRYYTGKPCKRGHDCERHTATGGCVECANHNAAKSNRAKSPTQANAYAERMAQPISQRLELSELEQGNALEVFSVAGSMDDAAAALGLTAAQLAARQAMDPTFDAAMRKIAVRFEGQKSSALYTPRFNWTAASRAQLIERYVDSGDIAEARELVGASPSAYHRELETNSEFARAIAEAAPLAKQHLRERAIQLALRGNDKVLTAVLKAEFPEFRDTLKVDMNHSIKSLSDAELDKRLEKLNGKVIDAQFVQVPLIKQEKAVDDEEEDPFAWLN